jgi:hypothetical protein
MLETRNVLDRTGCGSDSLATRYCHKVSPMYIGETKSLDCNKYLKWH